MRKGDEVVTQVNDAAVGNGDAVSVAAEVFEDMLHSSKGLLGEDNPSGASEPCHPTVEGFGVGEGLEVSEEAFGVQLSDESQQFAAQQHAHDLDGEEVLGTAWFPAGAIGREPTGTHERVHVGMKAQIARPSVQYHRDGKLRFEVCPTELEQRLARCCK